MQGFDPRAIADVVVRDQDNPTSPYGVSPDTSWEVRILISAVLTQDLMSAPENITNPTRETMVIRTSLISWLRPFGKYDFLADGLSSTERKDQKAHQATQLGPVKSSQRMASTPAASEPSTPIFSMTKSAMVQHHQHEWPTIAADIHGATDNGLSIAKARARGWIEAKAMAWAHSKGKLVAPHTSTLLVHSMNNIVGKKHTLDD